MGRWMDGGMGEWMKRWKDGRRDGRREGGIRGGRDGWIDRWGEGDIPKETHTTDYLNLETKEQPEFSPNLASYHYHPTPT